MSKKTDPIAITLTNKDGHCTARPSTEAEVAKFKEAMIGASIGNDHPLNQMMWAEFLRWAVGNPDICRAYEKETGMLVAPDPKASGLKRAIDGATGRIDPECFMVWATIRMWGEEFTPEKFLRRIAHLRETKKNWAWFKESK